MRKICLLTVAGASILAGVGAWVTSTTYARVVAPAGAGVDPLRIMLHAASLPATEFIDDTFVFH
jgi:hypothetical protein